MNRISEVSGREKTMTTDALLPTIIMAVIVLALEWIERRMTIH